MVAPTEPNSLVDGLVFGFFMLVVVYVFVSNEYNNLISMAQHVKREQSKYGAALDLCSESIEGMWEIFDRYLDHEKSVFSKVAEARSAFSSAKSQGDPQSVAAAANSFLNASSIVESYPELKSAPLSLKTLASLQAQVAKITETVESWSDMVEEYNSSRNSVFGSLVARLGNKKKLPEEFAYYIGEKAKLDVSELFKKTN